MSINLDYRTRDLFLQCISQNVNEHGLLTDIIDMVKEEFDVGQIVGDDEAVAYVAKHFSADEVFSLSDLEDWALSNGFVRES